MNNDLPEKIIFNLYYKELIYFAIKKICDRQAAEDIVTDSFLKFFELNYDHDKARSSLYFLVYHRCISYLLTKKRHDRIEKTMPDFSNEMLEADILKALDGAINELPNDSKEVIILFYLKEMTCIQISRVLNKPADTIRSLKRYGLNKLFNLIKLT